MAQSQLIEDILDVSRIIGGKLRLNLAAVSLRDVIEESLDSVAPAADAKCITIAPPPRRGRADHRRQGSAAAGVLEPPLECRQVHAARRPRRRPPRAASAATRSIAVEDTGIGISPEFLPYVFDRFTQADGSATRRHGGLGLGMAIVRHLVELHGGTVRAYSEGENRGTTFTATLPMRATAVPESPEAFQPELLAGMPETPANLNGVRILVVDDDPDSRGFLSALLQKQGATVWVAGSTGEAIDAFTCSRPDVLISDIAMPGQDGYDLIRQVRDLAPHEGGRTPAVALTAYVRAEDAEAALSAGYQRHIRKPVVVAELLDAVAALAAAGATAPGD